MATTQYIGARYVPKFYEGSNDTEWDPGVEYEPLTIVTYLNNSYTSRKFVPNTIGSPNLNSEYWAATGNYNAQVQAYREEVEALSETIDDLDNYVTPEMYGAIGDKTTDDSNAFNEALNSGKKVIASGTYKVSTITMPNNTTLELINGTTINVTGGIFLGENCLLKGETATIYTTDNSEHSLVHTGRRSTVILKRVSGIDVYTYNEGEYNKGVGSNVTGLRAFKTDFIKCNIEMFDDLKYAYYIHGGAGGADYTINDSDFISQWIADCQCAFYQAGSSNTFITTSAYIESCGIGYSLIDSFYGKHYIHFDDVTTFFECRNTDWKNRMSDVYIPRMPISTLKSRLSGVPFVWTTFHCLDGIIISKNNDNANFCSDNEGKLFFKSGDAEFKIISSEALTQEGKISDNETGNGMIGSLGTGGKFTLEAFSNSSDRLKLFEVDGLGTTYIRQTTTIGDGQNYTDLIIRKGGVKLGQVETQSAIPNVSLFADNLYRLCFKDGNGVVHHVAFSD